MANNQRTDFNLLRGLYEAYEPEIQALMNEERAAPVDPTRYQVHEGEDGVLAHRLIDQRGLHGRRAAEKGMPALDLLRRLARNPAPEDEQGMFVQQPIDLTEDQGLETGEMGPSADPQTPATLAPRKKQSSHRHVHDPDKTARPPPGIDISIREICAFCPGWFNIPDVIVRAYRNGWDRIDLGNAIAYHLGDVGGSLNEGQELLMQQNASKGGKLYLGRTQDQRFDKNDLLKLGRENDMTATNWRYRDHYAVPLGWKDYKQPTHTKDVELSRFREGVVNWPTGEDRLLFTEILEYDRANPQLNLTTADYGQILQQLQHIAVPLAPAPPSNRDVEALARFGPQYDAALAAE